MKRQMMACFVVAGLALAAAAYESVTVGDGESVTIGGDVTNADTVELTASAGATIVLPAASSGGNAYIYTRLILTGEGTVTLVAPSEDYTAKTVGIVGGVTAADTVTLHVAAPSVTAFKVGKSASETSVNYVMSDIANVTFANPNGVFGLREAVTVKKIPSVYTINSDGDVRLALYGSNPLHLTDSLALTNFDVVALTADSIPVGCTVTVNPGRTFYVKPCNLQPSLSGVQYSHSWFWGGSSTSSVGCPIVLNGRGARVYCRSNKDSRLLANISGLGEVFIRPDSTSNIKTIFRGMTFTTSPSAPATVPINTTSEPAPTDSWRAKVAHWFDASDATSYIYYDYPNVTTNYEGHPLVIGWKDKDKDIGDIYLYNRRMYNGTDPTVSKDVPQVLPYVVENGLNGLNYLAFLQSSSRLPFHSASTVSTGSQAPTGGNTATFTNCPFCIMVFGSQAGGGYAILGDKKRSFARKPGIGNVWMTNNVCKLIVDGYEVTPTSAKPNGQWQILSVDMSATEHELSCIGAEHAVRDTSNNPSGQNYAELIFFSEKPTVEERMSCERYLAEKWGLASSYLSWDVAFTELSGTGTVDLADVNKPNHEPTPAVTVAGNFTGTINVPADRTLIVSDRPAPPTAADLPQQNNITAWFDPSLEGAIDFNESGSKPTGVARLYSRTAVGVDKSEGTCWMGANTLGSSSGRYPFLVQTAYSGGFGVPPTIGWMDFTKESNGSGNTLRSRGIALTNTFNSTTTAMNLRSVFLAMDSSLGGGNPVADDVYMKTMFKPRKGSVASEPIWSPSNTVTMTHTWLGTNEVDGTTTGFGGRGEVLGFETSEQKSMPLFLGFYKGGGNSETNFEHIGETIIYQTALSDAERQIVQKYLMAKWLGDFNSEYSDLTGATVTGAGSVKSATLRNLPQFDAGFTGSVSGGSALAFTIDPAVSTTTATDALTFGCPVTLDASSAVTVTLKGALSVGTYTLLTAQAVTLPGNAIPLSLVDVTGRPTPPAQLVVRGTTLALEVVSRGTMVIFR